MQGFFFPRRRGPAHPPCAGAWMKFHMGIRTVSVCETELAGWLTIRVEVFGILTAPANSNVEDGQWSRVDRGLLNGRQGQTVTASDSESRATPGASASDSELITFDGFGIYGGPFHTPKSIPGLPSPRPTPPRMVGQSDTLGDIGAGPPRGPSASDLESCDSGRMASVPDRLMSAGPFPSSVYFCCTLPSRYGVRRLFRDRGPGHPRCPPASDFARAGSLPSKRRRRFPRGRTIPGVVGVGLRGPAPPPRPLLPFSPPLPPPSPPPPPSGAAAAIFFFGVGMARYGVGGPVQGRRGPSRPRPASASDSRGPGHPRWI